MAVRMQQRRGTSEQWTLANPILAEGEIGFETDGNKFKLGDGVNRWNTLAYFVNVDGLGEQLEDYIPIEEKGEPDGVATLDSTGQVPANQLGNATVDLSDYATEQFVNDATQVLGIKEAVNVASSVNIEDFDNIPNGILDGVTLTVGTRILVKNQTNSTENGIYVSIPGIASPPLSAFGTADVTNTSQSVTYNKGAWLLDGVSFVSTQGSYVRLSGFNVLDANGNLDPQGAININGDWPIDTVAGGGFYFSYSTTLSSVINLLGSSYASNLGSGTIEIDFIPDPTYPIIRADDALTGADLQNGSFVFVKNGASYANTGWLQTLNLPEGALSGENTIVWEQFSGYNLYLAGNGLNLNQNNQQFTIDENIVATRQYVDDEIADIPVTDLTGYATEGYVDTAIENVVGLAPETLDTLAELATALGDDPNAITSLQNNKADTNSPTFTGLTDFEGIVDFSEAVVIGIETGPVQSSTPHPFSMIG
jgi:hypothetical protein